MLKLWYGTIINMIRSRPVCIRPDMEEAKLPRRLREIAADHIRWGRRMAYRVLRREGWLVNHKRVHRLWCKEGLQRPTSGLLNKPRPTALQRV